MTRANFKFGIRDYLLHTLAFIIGMALSSVPSIRLLWMAGILAVMPIYLYLRFRQVYWTYIIMVAGLAAFAGLMWIHPGLPWLFLVPVIFFGFVIGPIWRALHDLRGARQSAK